MKNRVIRPFRWLGMVRMPGQVLELSVQEAGRLRRMGLVGSAEQAVKLPAEQAIPPAPERAVKPPAEQRVRRPRKKKVKDAIQSDADSGAGE